MLARVQTLGREGPPLPRLGLGCEQLGGYQWGASDPAELEAAVVRAVELGIRLFDTADCYGRGESESRLGRLLGPYRSEVLIATKYGVRFASDGKVYYDASPAWARESLDGSLRRLGVDCVDLFQLHYPDGVTPLGDVVDCLQRLREAGKCRYIGVTNVPMDMLPPGAERLLSSVSYEYSLVAGEHAAQIRAATELGLAALTYGTLGQGMLSGRYDAGHRFPASDRRSREAYRNFHGSRAQANAGIVATLKDVAMQLDASPAQVAIAYVLERQHGVIPLVGSKRPAQIEDAAGALRLGVPETLLARLDEAATAQECT